MSATRALGRWGENMAARHLESLGWVVLDRNWRHRDGELDIVARDAETVVFVEVKTRRGTGAGHPLEAITYRKRVTLHRLALLWLRAHEIYAGDFRLDAIGVLAPRGQRPRLEHVRGLE